MGIGYFVVKKIQLAGNNRTSRHTYEVVWSIIYTIDIKRHLTGLLLKTEELRLSKRQENTSASRGISKQYKCTKLL